MDDVVALRVERGEPRIAQLGQAAHRMVAITRAQLVDGAVEA